MDLTDSISMYVEDRIETGCSILRDTNEEYCELFRKRKEHVAKHDLAIASLDDAQRKLLEECEMDTFRQTAIEQQGLYKQGYHDCIALLKHLRLL